MGIIDWEFIRKSLRLDTLEDHVTSAHEQIDNLTVRFDDFAADVRAALATLTAERDNLTAAGQAALDRLSARVATADAEVGDADRSEVPPA